MYRSIVQLLFYFYCSISMTRVVRAGDVAHTEAVWAFKILQLEDRQYVLIYCSAIVLFLLFY